MTPLMSLQSQIRAAQLMAPYAPQQTKAWPADFVCLFVVVLLGGVFPNVVSLR